MATDTIYLTGLTPREEIADLLYRCCWAFDTNNKEMWESAWLDDPEIVMELNGNVLKGMESINTDCFDKVGFLDTQHLVSGVRIDIKSDDTAYMTANAQNQHFRQGEGLDPTTDNFMAGSMYFFDVVKNKEGAWKLKKFVLKFTWSTGDYTALWAPKKEQKEE